MPITVIVGAIKEPNPNDQDSVDKGIATSKVHQVKSKSAKEFYDGVKKLHDACVEKRTPTAAASSTSFSTGTAKPALAATRGSTS